MEEIYAREVVPKQARGCIQVEQALCLYGRCQVLMAFGSSVVDAHKFFGFIFWMGNLVFLWRNLQCCSAAQHSCPHLLHRQIALFFEMS